MTLFAVSPASLPPLFVPLLAEWFEAFRLGIKDNEWRRNLTPWTADRCIPGRRALLANGYGWPRLAGVIRDFEVLASCPEPAFDRIYPGWVAGGGRVSRIGIDLDHSQPLILKPTDRPHVPKRKKTRIRPDLQLPMSFLE